MGKYDFIKLGNLLYWHDPDSGLSNGVYQVASIPENIEEDSVILIASDTSEAEVFPSELSPIHTGRSHKEDFLRWKTEREAEGIEFYDHLSKVMDTNDEWISSRTGIRSRHISIEDTTSTMAVKAAEKALEDAGISAEELEESCRKCVRIEVTNVKALVRVLDEMKTDYNIISDNVADIFAKINISKLTLALSKENCEVISMQERDESLESYYVGLVGGKDNE